MAKRIEVIGIQLLRGPAVEPFYRATSRRYGVTAYGRTVSEAKSRLFLTRQAEYRNLFAALKLLPPENHRHYLT